MTDIGSLKHNIGMKPCRLDAFHGTLMCVEREKRFFTYENVNRHLKST